MTTRDALAAAVRMGAGTSGSIVAGLAFFGPRTFRPGLPYSQCITVGALLAGVLALSRARKPIHAAGVAAAFTLFQVGAAWHGGWRNALSAFLGMSILCAGLVMVAILYHFLAEEGYRFGKFLLVGPLLGGAYLAATPPAALWGVQPANAVRSLILNLLLGIVIGDGVGFGTEMAELFMGRRK